MCFVNGSWSATKLLFDKTSVRTYIFAFWLIRSFVIEILKGQIIYSFILSFHSILIFATDTWYMCDRKVLLFSMVLYLVLVVYEFFVSISPVGPSKPSWQFINIEITANSLSRSNYFNLFLIFTDAMIVVLYDSSRSKYVMLVKKHKREKLEVPLSKEYKLKRLWALLAAASFLAVSIHVIQTASDFIRPGLYDVSIGTITGIWSCSYFAILYFSSSSKATSVLYRMMHERRVIFIVLLTGILFYIDNIVWYWTLRGVAFPLVIIFVISFDLIVMYFPRRLALVTISLLVILLCFNIFKDTFLQKDCNQRPLPWGIFGKKLRYCTVRRIIYQSILSLMVSPVIAIFAGRTDNLFFCNVNVYRSTGTIDERSVNKKYVESMKMEKDRSIAADKSKIDEFKLELT